MNLCYSELIRLPTFKERIEYVRLGQTVGDETFGYDRYLNQLFYHRGLWLHKRRDIIIRDDGLDLACPGHKIVGSVYVHHLNPVNIDALLNNDFSALLDDENLVSMSYDTHQFITFGKGDYEEPTFVERRPNDTSPWRH